MGGQHEAGAACDGRGQPDPHGSQGGLGDLIAEFQQADLGDTVGSWVGSGQNQPVSGEPFWQWRGFDRYVARSVVKTSKTS